LPEPRELPLVAAGRRAAVGEAGRARLVDVEAFLVVGVRRGGEDAHVARVPDRLRRASDQENRPSACSESLNAACTARRGGVKVCSLGG
jgi:hypothetical protein